MSGSRPDSAGAVWYTESMKTTQLEAQKRIAKEITDDLRTKANDSHLIFAEARTAWEAQCEGNFDTFITELVFTDEAWIASSYRGQQRHGRGYRGDANKQLTKLYIF